MVLKRYKLPANLYITKRRLVKLLIVLAIIGGLILLVYKRRERKLRPTIAGWRAEVTTFAGDGTPGYQEGLTLKQARFRDPFGLTLDRTGNLYVSDAGDNNSIRKITKEGIVSTLAGSHEGFSDGLGAAAAFNTPSALAIDYAGNIYVADTGNNRIRKITPEGIVTTLAGDGVAGYRDGPAEAAEFNGPVGVAVDQKGNVYVADTYNDYIRLIGTDGQVKTLAGGGTPGDRDGDALSAALFDTPCALVVTPSGELLIADTGNNQIRKLTHEQQIVTIIPTTDNGESFSSFSSPVGLAVTHDNFLYVTESDGGRIQQIAPDGRIKLIAGKRSGFADGDGQDVARFNHPAALAVDTDGALLVADSANYLIRKLTPVEKANGRVQAHYEGVLPDLSPTLSGLATNFPWPVDPQNQRHEVVATMGEVRGSYEGESRDHLHSGIDVQAPYGATVRVVYDEKVTSPLCNWAFGELNEGLRVGLFSYIHLRVGRDAQDHLLDDRRFIPVSDEHGQIRRVRIRRGTRFHIGDALGTINRMYHVHLNLGPPGAEVNPLTLSFIGFSDHIAPQIEHDGIQILNQSGARLTDKLNGRIVLHGSVRIVVDAYDQVDGNSARRRLGLYKLGYQILRPDETPASGFEQPRITMLFDRLPSDSEAVKIAYADQSGITVYGSATTRFLYEITNTVRDGQVANGSLDTSQLPKGDYVLRIIAADLAGNEATAHRDLPISIE